MTTGHVMRKQRNFSNQVERAGEVADCNQNIGSVRPSLLKAVKLLPVSTQDFGEHLIGNIMPVATRLDERLERLGDEGEVAQPACKVVLVRDGVEEEIRYCTV